MIPKFRQMDIRIYICKCMRAIVYVQDMHTFAKMSTNVRPTPRHVSLRQKRLAIDSIEFRARLATYTATRVDKRG